MCESGETNNAVNVDTADGDDSGDDHQLEVQLLRDKINELETEKKDFGVQRAKMKSLMLQTEGEKVRLQSELEELRRQLAVMDLNSKNHIEEEKRKFDEQITSLEQLLHETVDESASSRTQIEQELKHLQAVNVRLEAELLECRKTVTGSSSGSSEDRHIEKEKSDPPPIQIITQATKTFARKVLSELGADSSSTSSKDTLEDSMRKAQEDAEVLRSLVIPLEEEIEALKEKLREAHEELQRLQAQAVQQNSRTPRKTVGVEVMAQSQNCLNQESILKLSPSANSEGTSFDRGTNLEDELSGKDLEVFLSGSSNTAASSSNSCNMCRNYEAGLQKAQQKIKELEKSQELADRNIQRAKDDLAREHAFRQEMEVKWNEKKEQNKIQVAELQKKVATAEKILHELQQTYMQTYQDVTQQLSRLEHDRTAIKNEIDKLQELNDRLVGKHNEHSQSLQNQIINLPSSVEELQELLLRRHEELIAAKVCAETQQTEADLLRDELQMQQVQNSQLVQDLQQLQKLVQKSEADKQRIHHLQSSEREALEQLEDLKGQLEKSNQVQVQLEENLRKQQSRISSLQHDLDMSEQVQKDFVRLSQSLQVQLEGFRQPNTQVRWQHEEDVDECPSCHNGFGSSSRKQHCKHCGRIFCNNCLSHKVPSGPQQRLSRVCDVCHTLLVPNTAPYFSTEPPSSPD